MTESYHVRLDKERFVFSAAHFITYAGDVCEPLHGHNYRVAVELHGPLDENHYVIDFIQVRDTLQRIVDELDHKMLLPLKHQTIRVTAGDNEVEVHHSDRRWIFPRQDCVLLPVANTTAELLARYIGTQLQTKLEIGQNVPPVKIQVAVDECNGQWGICETWHDPSISKD